MTNELELKEAADKLDRIRYLREQLAKARDRLKLVNEYVKTGQVWSPVLCLKRERGSSGWGDITIEINIPSGVIQQQAVYAVLHAERALIAEGVSP